MRSHSFTRLLSGARAALILALVFTLFGAGPARARPNLLDPVTWYVATTGNDANSCAAVDAPCLTINGAIAKAAAGDVIKVTIGTYTGSGTGVVFIDKDITLLGGWDEAFSAQTGRSSVDGQGSRRGIVLNYSITVLIDHFQIQHGAAEDGGGILNGSNALTLTSSIVDNNNSTSLGGGIYSYGELTIIGSTISSNTAGGAGGGILNHGTLTVSDSVIRNNTAEGIYSSGGGGILNEDGSATLEHSTISYNVSMNGGGGIHSQATLVISNSMVNNNTARVGGGISNYGTLTVTDTTIRSNTGAGTPTMNGAGAAMWNFGPATLNNTTISSNVIKGGQIGSGIVNLGFPLVLNNSTVSRNTGAQGLFNDFGDLTLNNSTVTGNAGGILSQSGTISLRNSIIAGNTQYDCDGSITSAGYNLIGQKTANCVFTKTAGDTVGTPASPINPLLSSLADHGGPTFTHALLAGSPALNAGNPAVPGSEENACLATDQRGVARPAAGVCDMGAFERYQPDVLSITRANGNPTSASTVKFTVKFSRAVSGVDIVAPFADFSLTKSGITGGSITAVSGSGSVYTVTVNTGKGNGSLRLNVVDNDSILDDSSNPLGGPGPGNGNFSGAAYTLKRIPIALNPSTTAWDLTPTFTWSRIPKAARYSFQVWKGTRLVYTMIVYPTACSISICKFTPITLLPTGSYKWRVRALTEGTWKAFSAYKLFGTLAPKAGFWKSAYEDFYITPGMSYVKSFSTYIYVQGCGSYKITQTALVPVNGNKFSFTGNFHASGTFDTTTRAHGTDGLYYFEIPGCGYVSGGPWSWKAIWINGSQPAAVQLEGDPVILLLPELDTSLPRAFIVDPLP